MADDLLMALLAVRRGDDNAIERMAHKDVTRLTRYAITGLHVPYFVEFGDCRQVMSLGLWSAAKAWDPSLGPRLRAHAMWNGISSTRKFVNIERNVPGRRSSAGRSRYARPASSFTSPDGEPLGIEDLAPPMSPIADRVLEATQHYERLLDSLGETDAVIATVLVEQHGDVRGTVTAIWRDRKMRAQFGTTKARLANKVEWLARALAA